MRQPGADIGREIATGERADSELDAFISRRDAQRLRDEGEERAEEEAWLVSSRLMDARRRDENLAAWRRYHREQAERHRRNGEALTARHEEQAKKLREGDAA